MLVVNPPSDQDEVVGEQNDYELLQHARKIFTPVRLPCGRVVPNRLVKVCFLGHTSLETILRARILHAKVVKLPAVHL